MKPRLPRAVRRPGGPLLSAPDLARGERFLDRFDADDLRRELEREGVLPRLRDRGYLEVELHTSGEDGEHRLLIFPRAQRTSLVDLRLAETTLPVLEPVARSAGLEVLSVLRNSWLSLQDPRATFTPDRPRLPGQLWPGLGLARAFYGLMSRWARQWGKDAVLATPEYFHNAVFYSAAFRFLSPAEQGRFEALRRDLQPLSVAVASTLVDAGRVQDLATDQPFEWRPGPMVAPRGEDLRQVLEGAAYRERTRAAREAARFRAPSG